jgi:putative transposase
MAAAPGDWPWCSYRAHVGEAADLPSLDTHGLHGYLLQRPATTVADHRRAGRLYAQLVADGQGVALWDEGLRQQIYLGDECRRWPSRRAGRP